MTDLLQLKPPEDGRDLQRWLGRREAFGAVAACCSAADLECIRQIRDRKLFENEAANWDEFCTTYLRMSRRKVDGDLRLLDELGPVYFHLLQLIRVTPDEFRAIAAHVSEEGVSVNGE